MSVRFLRQEGPGSTVRDPPFEFASESDEQVGPPRSEGQSVEDPSVVSGAARTRRGAARLRATAAGASLCVGCDVCAAHKAGATLSLPACATGSEVDEVDVATSGDVTWSPSPNDVGKCIGPVMSGWWCAAAVGPGPPRPPLPSFHSLLVGGFGPFLGTLCGPYLSFKLAYNLARSMDFAGVVVCLPLVHCVPLLCA